MHLKKYFSTTAINLVLNLISCYGDTIPERICAKLYAKPDFDGDIFTMKDFDQSVSTKKDYRSSSGGWPGTGSIHLEDDCALTICSGTYFQGRCVSLIAGKYFKSSEVLESISSANCTCIRECKCSNILLRVPIHGYYEFGRAYLSGGCNSCDSKYIQLKQGYNKFPEAYKNEISAVVLPTGYSIKITAGRKTTTFLGPVVENFPPKPDSYRIDCIDTKLCNLDTFPNASSVPMLEIPVSAEKLTLMLYHNDTVEHHPGVQAIRLSFESRRSPRNVYVVILYDGEMSSFVRTYGTVFYHLFHLYGCWTTDSQFVITECVANLTINSLGIKFTQVHFLLVPVIPSNKTKENLEYVQLASLDEYLSTRADLQGRIPNLVLIQSTLDAASGRMRPKFHRVVKALSFMRTRLLDEAYSNALFFIDNYVYLNPSLQRNPENIFRKVETTLLEIYGLPKPIHIVPSVDLQFDIELVDQVNGFFRTKANEYFPRNLRQAIKLLTDRGGDPFGLAVLTDWFENAFRIPEAERVISNNVKVNKSKVEFYRQLLNNHSVSFSDRQISSAKQISPEVNLVEKLLVSNPTDALQQQAKELSNEYDEQLQDLNYKVRKLEQSFQLSEQKLSSCQNDTEYILQKHRKDVQAIFEQIRVLGERLQKSEQRVADLDLKMENTVTKRKKEVPRVTANPEEDRFGIFD